MTNANSRRATRDTGSREAPEKAATEVTFAKEDHWELRLYVAGPTPRSLAAVANLKRICERHPIGKFNVEVIDLIKKPELAKGDQIVAVPTLVRRLPGSVRKFIGHMWDAEQVFAGLQLYPCGHEGV